MIVPSSFTCFIFIIIFSELISVTSFRTSFQELKSSNLENQHNDDGNNNLISRFEEKEFECVGSCYCDEIDEKRKTSSKVTTVSKGLRYIIVSLSSLIAYERAKTYFESKCKEDFLEECHRSSSIKSSVEECSDVREKENPDKEYFEKRENEEQRVYFCYANCLPNLNHRKESTIKQFSHIKCEKLKREGEVIVHESDVIHKTGGHHSTDFVLTARSKFLQYFLVDFCKENSKMKYIYKGTQKKKSGKVYPFNVKLDGFGCIGRKSSPHKNVHCRQIDPEPESINWKWQLNMFNQRKKDWDLI